jgi:two-component sensor histidine kinase/putative methionine-R-sulfoxide reductase with GAF domain
VSEIRTIDKLLRQQSALASFGSFAFGERDLQKILTEAARICAQSLAVPYAKICRYRAEQNDLLVEAGYGWNAGVTGRVISQANESSTQGRAFVTGKPVILEDLSTNDSYSLPPFYADHGIVATADVLIKGSGDPWGVLEIDSATAHAFDRHDIDYLTGFANVVAEAVATSERTATLRAAVAQMEALIVEKDRLLAERQELLDEKEVLAEELQHRVRNNLQLVLGMLNQQIDESDSSDKEGMRAIARRVMSLAKLYDHLLGNGLSRTIDFDQYLRSLCESLSEVQGPREFEVTLSCAWAPNPLALDLDLVTALGIIIAEVISNAYIHAFPARKGTITVALARDATDVVLTIADDGVGFVEARSTKRHGLGLVRRLMEQIGGAVRVNADNGTMWTLAFPTGAERGARQVAA